MFSFEENVNIIFSTKNSVGKTTLLRLMMYALGYPIPNTRGIRFSDYETVLTVVGVIKSVKQDNPLIGELHELISSYAVRLGLDDKFVSARNDYIFTNDLKSLSGAIFHKVVFAFKISYVKLIQQHTGVCLPIILDSPSGREVSMENINEMMAILAENFTDHQIIIASIYNSYSFPNKNIIELTDRLLHF